MNSADVRAQLMEALRLDLVGPRPDHPPHAAWAEERLPIAPRKWYLCGFLVPLGDEDGSATEFDADDLLDQVRNGSGDDEAEPERTSARRARFPSSMGLSVLVPAGTEALTARVAWGDYEPLDPTRGDGTLEPDPETGDRPAEPRGGGGRWRRVPRRAELRLPLRVGRSTQVELPDHPGVVLVVSVRPVGDATLPAGTRSVSVFLVNQRRQAPDVGPDAAFLFQSELVLESEAPFVARPDQHGHGSQDPDEQIADVQYRDCFEHAVGHNVSALAELDGADCHRVRTTWMPSADVEKVVPADLSVELGMEALAEAGSGAAIRARVGPMVLQYLSWIGGQALPADARRREVAEELLVRARRAATRIQAGLDALDDPLVFEAFRLANRAVATAYRQRASHGGDVAPAAVEAPRWRPFQLAFILMNLVGAADREHSDRKVVDLLFFPTGGGKTEAYLGLAAFSMFLRRLRDPSIRSAGVSVLMRYTLRLLTLDQLGRAATLVCAMELMRQADVARLGRWPFEIGLWVGRGATPNRMGAAGDKDRESARSRTIEFQNESRGGSPPIPLENCPWCGWRFTKDSFRLLPDAKRPTELRVSCVHRACAFHPRRQAAGIPVLAVDEPIYRRLPAFLIATVDKFANLPWVGDTAGLFGRVARYDEHGFHLAGAGVGRALDGPLPPPDLIIQDELHLISGPLGTMVGLYEAAIDALASPDLGASGQGPKIVASTATVRRAQRQIRALFGRSAVEVFPPPGPDRRDSFFARTAAVGDQHPRTYLGIAAPGRNMKVVFLRTLLALMGSAQKAWEAAEAAGIKPNPADPYMTVLGYFNTLRELGGSRRIVEDEVATQLIDMARRRRRLGGEPELFADRKRITQPEELTSRVSTSQVADTKRRLALGFEDKERVDVALATNMISVGLDITRLGLMVVLAQPKTAAEYIQATSRVGRDDQRPGLVVTLLNVYRPRDRSHYERFAAWHASFYRAVEATSVTPYSPRAVDRGLAAVTVALARHGHEALTPPRGAREIAKHRGELDFVADQLSRRAEAHDSELGADEAEALRTKLRSRVNRLLDDWVKVVQLRSDLQYQREIGEAPALLFDPLDPQLARESHVARQFKAARSLRDVEPAVNLWLRDFEDQLVDGREDDL